MYTACYIIDYLYTWYSVCKHIPYMYFKDWQEALCNGMVSHKEYRGLVITGKFVLWSKK